MTDDTADIPRIPYRGYVFCRGSSLSTMINVDGDPAVKGIKLILSDPTKYEHIRFNAGGFHFKMNADDTRGKGFADTHFRAILRPDTYGRKSQKQQDWVLFPGDPNQLDAELPEYIVAHFIDALRQCAEEKGVDELSTEEVHDWRIERACEEPLAFVVLTELLFDTVVFLIQDSETDGKKGNPDLFLTALRFFLPFCTVTNKTGYVDLCID